MKSLVLQRETLENLELVIDASIDPTDTLIEFAFPPAGSRPTTWIAGIWRGTATGSGGRYQAVAITPSVGDENAEPTPQIVLPAGSYMVYVKIHSDLEKPVVHCGSVSVR